MKEHALEIGIVIAADNLMPSILDIPDENIDAQCAGLEVVNGQGQKRLCAAP